jgi:hypothetical protein
MIFFRKEHPANSLLNYIDPKNAKVCIFIEAKRSLNKIKLDDKLKQILRFKNVLSYINDTSKDQTKLPKQLSESIVRDSLKTFPETIYILFGAEDMPLELKQFILSINNGITKEIYEHFIFLLFKTDQTYIYAAYDSKISDDAKKYLKNINSIEELRLYCHSGIPDTLKKALCYYLKPFEEFQKLYLE